MFESVGGFMLPIDKDIRDEILTTEGNIVISASAGTGKTYTTIQRITKDAEEHTNYQTFAAVTFTRKAAKEIINRLGPNKGEGFVGTNDNFIWLEIIQPFMYDVYGMDFKKEIKPDFDDENQIETFDEGIEKIRNTQLMCKYRDIKKNFAFQLALEILKNSQSSRRYMKAKYYRIYIDEYQDSDVDMHNFFMYLCDELDIPLFIVGDAKQSIYAWRGAYSDGFTGLFIKQSFRKFELWHNFRSNTVIQNYSNIFMESVRRHYQQTEFKDEVIVFKYSIDSEAIDYIKDWINVSKKCAFLNFSNINSEAWSEQLKNVGIPFVFIPGSPLDYSNLESEHIWIARAMAHYSLQHRYSEYDFRDEIPMPEAYRFSDIKKMLKEIKESQYDPYLHEENCIKLYEYLGYSEDLDKIKKEIGKLYEVVNDEKYIPTYNQDRYKLTSGTIHSSKGLEFEQVIINAQDYDMTRDGIKFLHYVAISRPEERLLIIAKNGFMDRYKGYIDTVISETQNLGIEIEVAKVIKIIE
ncbi:ATP-dependent helicase (plasmid) [Bacillus mycoides]|uniref:UvrD-helicase domain-containing protein n=1 Tax=Bacillus mycoides TaxID=1405 RepID=UPI001C031CCE|nr:UvrD-helicase domain-containing protein [Bacillus mycoides]QWH15293.1 ATP-dependent helicase [Bacillus mycoides]